MQIEVLKSKIHCATVTEANLNYMGSITIDENLLDAADMIAGQKVQIVDNNNGERFETYIIKGERGSGCVCLNGAAARKVQVGDVIIIIAYAIMDFEEAKTFQPRIVFPDDQNRIWGFKYCPTPLIAGANTAAASLKHDCPLKVYILAYTLLTRDMQSRHQSRFATHHIAGHGNVSCSLRKHTRY